MRLSSSSININNHDLSHRLPYYNYPQNYFNYPITSIKSTFNQNLKFENQNKYYYSNFNSNISDYGRNKSDRFFYKNNSAENIYEKNNLKYHYEPNEITSKEIMDMKISFDLLKNKITQLKDFLSKENKNYQYYKNKENYNLKDENIINNNINNNNINNNNINNNNINNYYKNYPVPNSISNSSLNSKNSYSINSNNEPYNILSENYNSSDLDKYIINNRAKNTLKQYSVNPYTNNYLINNYKPINYQNNSASYYYEYLNKYKNINLENKNDKSSDELSVIANDLIDAFNNDNLLVEEDIYHINDNCNSYNNNVNYKNLEGLESDKFIHLFKSKNDNYQNFNYKRDYINEKKYDKNIDSKNFKKKNFEPRICYLKKKNIKLYKKKDENKLYEYNILKSNSPIKKIDEKNQIKKSTLINHLKDVFNEYEKEEDDSFKNRTESYRLKRLNEEENEEVEKKENDFKFIENGRIQSLGEDEEENELEIFADIIQKTKGINNEINNKYNKNINQQNKKNSSSKDKKITKYKENDTKLDNNDKKINFIKFNNYLNKNNQKSILLNSPGLEEKIKKSLNEKLKKKKLKRNFSNIIINDSLKQKYNKKEKKNNNENNNKVKNEKNNEIISRNINLIKTIESYSKKGIKYPLCKKNKEHKPEDFHICNKVINNPQKFFTVKVFDNLLESYNIKGKNNILSPKNNLNKNIESEKRNIKQIYIRKYIKK